MLIEIMDIKQGFKKLKDCHNWCLQNYPEALGLSNDLKGNIVNNIVITLSKKNKQFARNKLLPALKRVITDLEGLGVPRVFSIGFFIFGGQVTQDLIKQFIGNTHTIGQ